MRACAGGLYSRCTTRAPESSLSLSSLFLSFSPSPHPDDCRLYSARLRKCIYTRSFSSACYVCMYVCVCAGEPHIQFSRRGNHNHRLRASGARVSATWPSRHGDSFLFSFSLSALSSYFFTFFLFLIPRGGASELRYRGVNIFLPPFSSLSSERARALVLFLRLSLSLSASECAGLWERCSTLLLRRCERVFKRYANARVRSCAELLLVMHAHTQVKNSGRWIIATIFAGFLVSFSWASLRSRAV